MTTEEKLEQILSSLTGLSRTVMDFQGTMRATMDRMGPNLDLVIGKLDDLTVSIDRLERRLTALEDWRRRVERSATEKP